MPLIPQHCARSIEHGLPLIGLIWRYMRAGSRRLGGLRCSIAVALSVATEGFTPRGWAHLKALIKVLPKRGGGVKAHHFSYFFD